MILHTKLWERRLSSWVLLNGCGGDLRCGEVSFLRVFAGLSCSCARRRRRRARFRSLAATAGRSRSLVRASLRLQLIARWQLRGASRVAALVHGGCRRALHECHMLCSFMRCLCTSNWVSLLSKIERGPAAGFFSVFVPVLPGPTGRLPRQGELPLWTRCGSSAQRLLPSAASSDARPYTTLRGTLKSSDHS